MCVCAGGGRGGGVVSSRDFKKKPANDAIVSVVCSIYKMRAIYTAGQKTTVWMDTVAGSCRINNRWLVRLGKVNCLCSCESASSLCRLQCYAAAPVEQFAGTATCILCCDVYSGDCESFMKTKSQLRREVVWGPTLS